MIDRNTYQETFSRLHASGDTVSEVLKMAREQETRPSKRRLSRRALGALIAAAMALVLSVTAIAVSGTMYGSRPAERQISDGD